MNKKIILLLACITVASTAFAQKNIGIGIRGGVGHAYQSITWDGATSGPRGDARLKPVYNLGAFGNYNLINQRLYLVTAMGYRATGSLKEYSSAYQGAIISYREDFTIGYMDLDAGLQYYFREGAIRPYIGAGARANVRVFESASVEVRGTSGGDPSLMASISDEFKANQEGRAEDLLDDYRRGNVSGIFKLGIQLSFFFVELEYSPDFMAASEGQRTFDNGRTSTATVRNNVMGVNAGIRLIGL